VLEIRHEKQRMQELNHPKSAMMVKLKEDMEEL
jgi:hypothetical protein